MRVDRALDIARDPMEHDLDDVVAALVALRFAHDRQCADLEATRDDRLEAAKFRGERIDVAGRLQSAIELHNRDVARVEELLGLLDVHAPNEARDRRAAWGVHTNVDRP